MPGLPLLLGAFALFTQTIGGAVTRVRVSGLDQATRGEAIPIEPLRLKVRRVRPSDVRPFVPAQPEPAQAVEDAGDHVGRGSLDVGVFDAEQERAVVAARIEPVEERRARAADVQIAGR